MTLTEQENTENYMESMIWEEGEKRNELTITHI